MFNMAAIKYQKTAKTETSILKKSMCIKNYFLLHINQLSQPGFVCDY